MNKQKLSKSEKIRQQSLMLYLKRMKKLNELDYDDDCIKDMEDWGAVEALIGQLIQGEPMSREGLMEYLGDEERVELVLSYYYMAKDLIENGATLDI